MPRLTTLTFVASLTLALACGGGEVGSGEPAGPKVSMEELAAYAGAQDDLNKAISYYNSGSYEQALMHIDAAIDSGTFEQDELADAYTRKGNILNELDRLDEAVSAHKLSLKLNDQDASTWVNLGVVYRLQRDYTAARDCYEKAMALDPDYPELYASLGSVLLYQGDRKESLRVLDEGVKLGPDIAIMHSNRAVALAYNGRYEEAEQALQEAEALGYDNGAGVRALIAEVKAGGDPLAE
ncbi:MAG: tetratricopeptide repeat protein [Myxococcota bacterium]|nr:tetratricopeptide repeat protein [Myxococcota bacterium]